LYSLSRVSLFITQTFVLAALCHAMVRLAWTGIAGTGLAGLCGNVDWYGGDAGGQLVLAELSLVALGACARILARLHIVNKASGSVLTIVEHATRARSGALLLGSCLLLRCCRRTLNQQRHHKSGSNEHACQGLHFGIM